MREAGFSPNQLNAPHGKVKLLQSYADLARELGRLPVSGDLRLKAKSDPQFPSHNTFGGLGKKSEFIGHLLDFCRDRKEYESVVTLCERYAGCAGRREYELALQLPEKAVTLHIIRTDDPIGIEASWHQRFDTQRKNGEWFDLFSDDVAAFKRRKFM
ncbi:MAG TPA: GIY-YIG nuclease family protein [Nitrospiraceae bacterium]|nr:GIY-YIG nuclease family protein [Nitrospiraceae bacterium]